MGGGIVASHQSQTPVFLPLPVAIARTAHMHRRERNQADWWDLLQCEIFGGSAIVWCFCPVLLTAKMDVSFHSYSLM